MKNLGYAHGTKPDIERLGIFIEMSYLDRREKKKKKVKPVILPKSFILGAAKTKSANQDGYFDEKFVRVFDGEGTKKKPKELIDLMKISKSPFVPPGFPKMHSTPGDHYGTFRGVVEAFSPKRRETQPYKREPANFLTKPGRKGGYGYADICLSKYPKHLPHPKLPKPTMKFLRRGDPLVTAHYTQSFFDLNPFKERNPKSLRLYVKPKDRKIVRASTENWVPVGPAKWDGGCKGGTFDPYPEHKTDRNKKLEEKIKRQKVQMLKELSAKDKYLPQSMGLKSLFHTSILMHKVDLSCNVKNCKSFSPTYTARLLKPLF